MQSGLFIFFLLLVPVSHGVTVSSGTEKFHSLLENTQGKSEWSVVNYINRYVNRNITDGEDSQIWQSDDFWATPSETLAYQIGDCEDFAILKYWLLRHAGIASANLFFSHVSVEGLKLPHMVVIYINNDNEMYVLDNLTERIMPVQQRLDLHYVYSFNESGMWQASTHHPLQKQLTRSVLIKHWQQMRGRWNSQKIIIPVAP